MQSFTRRVSRESVRFGNIPVWGMILTTDRFEIDCPQKGEDMSGGKGLILKAVLVGVAACFGLMGDSAFASDRVWRFDCGAPDSPVAVGYSRLTESDTYSEDKGYGWEGYEPSSLAFPYPPQPTGAGSVGRPAVLAEHLRNSYDDLNRDGVISMRDLIFRADVSVGTYRVTAAIGDMSQAIGSIDVYMNGELVEERVAAWAPGSYRTLMRNPSGWWTKVRKTVTPKDGFIRLRLTKNQSYYDRMMVEQVEAEKPLEDHYWRVGVTEPPYYYIGWPFVHNSVMAIEIVPHREPPVVGEDDKLRLTGEIDSRGLADAVRLFNEGDYEGALRAASRVRERDAQVAKAIVMLWLVGRLETGLENDQALVRSALPVLRNYVESHPEENGVAEILQDAELFDKALHIHLTRGEAALGENHFVENDKAISYWWLINEGTPLYYKAQLYIARAEHMLIPYLPARGTYREILRKLEKKFPDDRFVKYHLHEEWERYGDGSRYYDWYVEDYDARVKDSPEWVRWIYPALQKVADWSEWWIKFKQQPEGSIGGGWGDDVEIVGAFGYMGYVSTDVSDILVKGTGRLMDGLWNFSEVDPELGYCRPMADAEHTAEWTGNTLGMMVKIDYGNPVWIERSMKTGKLMRDLWTAYNVNGKRHFRANFFGATQVGSGDRMNDSWINYRAVRPAAAVLAYNQNPTLAKLFVELAEAWAEAAMSTDRGKPSGIIPAQVSFPDAVIGGTNSPNWYTASHPPGTVNADWFNQPYKAYIQDLLLTAYRQTREPRHIEPLRLEYDFVAEHGELPEEKSGLRLQVVTEPEVFGKRDPGEMKKRSTPVVEGKEEIEIGSDEWVAEKLQAVNQWLVAKRIVEGRQGDLDNAMTKQDIIRAGIRVNSELAWRWPMNTTEAGPTDRIAFVGLINPYLVYTGGWIGGPLLEASVTYENTTRDFAAAVMGSDEQGLRILYHSLAPDTREVGIRPWHLEPGGKYSLKYGPDADEDEEMDSVIEDRQFVFPQAGTPIRITVEPRVTYVVEIEQVERGRTASLAPDPAVTPEDITYDDRIGLIMVRVHNVGSEPVRDVRVAVFDGDPDAGGEPIGSSVLPHIGAPIDLNPATTTAGFSWSPAEEGRKHDIYAVVDPDGELDREITTFNNVAHATLPKEEQTGAEVRAPLPVSSTGRGRR